jgi:hypothetical protein
MGMGTLQILKCHKLFFKGKHCVKCQILITCCVSCVIFNKKKYNLVCHTLLEKAQCYVSDTNNSMNYMSFFNKILRVECLYLWVA